MKKVVLCLIGLYLAIAVLCFVFDRQPAGEVAMIHIKANRAVLLGSTDECLEIILYLTDTDSFFTETSNIESVSIQDENQMVMASVAKIMPNSQTLNIASLLYFPFSYQLVFDQVITSGGQLIFFQPHCQIVYQNGVMLDIEMGDLTLSFMDVSPIEHLDFTRLYGLFNRLDGREFCAGIVIGLKKYPLGDLRLESVDTTLANSVLDLAQARMIDSPVSPFTEITSLVPEYSPIKASEAINSASFVLTDAETLIVIPMVYQDLTLRTPQFPLIVTYSYSGNQYQFVLDDFIFFQNHDYAEKSDSDVWRYLYQY